MFKFVKRQEFTGIRNEVFLDEKFIGIIDELDRPNSDTIYRVTWFDGVKCVADMDDFEQAVEFLVYLQDEPCELIEDEHGLIF